MDRDSQRAASSAPLRRWFNIFRVASGHFTAHGAVAVYVSTFVSFFWLVLRLFLLPTVIILLVLFVFFIDHIC